MSFCAETANIWVVLGWVVLIFKIVIPLLLIIFGMVDLGKAVVSSDDKAISKAVSQLIRRFIAAIVIFFIPTIVSAIFGILGVIGENNRSDFEICVQCVTNMDRGMEQLSGQSCSEYVNTTFNSSKTQTE